MSTSGPTWFHGSVSPQHQTPADLASTPATNEVVFICKVASLKQRWAVKGIRILQRARLEPSSLPASSHLKKHRLVPSSRAESDHSGREVTLRSGGRFETASRRKKKKPLLVCSFLHLLIGCRYESADRPACLTSAPPLSSTAESLRSESSRTKPR